MAESSGSKEPVCTDQCNHFPSGKAHKALAILTGFRRKRSVQSRTRAATSVQPFGHSARTSQTGQTEQRGQRTDSIGRTVLQTVAQIRTGREFTNTMATAAQRLYVSLLCTGI